MKNKYRTILIIIAICLPLTVQGLTIEEEKKLGRETFREIAGAAPLYYDPYVSPYLNGIKERIEATAGMPFPIVLTVIDSPEANAFATYGGYVYLTTGLIAFCGKEEELAGVMAHEFAHVERRHISKRIEKQKYVNAAMIGTMLLSALVGGAGKGAVFATGMASAQALSLKYSREDEEEADKVGTVFGEKAGYGGVGIADFLRKMRASGADTTLPQYLLTHPYAEERIQRIESLWSNRHVSVDTVFFPYLRARVSIFQHPPKTGTDEMWKNRYASDPRDPVNGYGLAVVYLSKGAADEALKILNAMDSPYKKEFLGEALVAAGKFPEAIRILQHDPAPASRYFLARAYEGQGNTEMAVNILMGLMPYSHAYPEILYRLGMVAGRTGQEGRGFEYLGRYYLETGRWDLAKSNLEKAVTKYGINSREAREILPILDHLKP
jgi:predicted Zn-dependent protease